MIQTDTVELGVGSLPARRNTSRIEIRPDNVWISSQAKIQGIRKELDERSANGATMIALVAHFPDVLAELERIAAEYTGSASVRAVLAGQLSSEDPRSLPLGEPITHNLLTRSIQRAQRKIEAESIGRHDAESAAAWLARNTQR